MAFQNIVDKKFLDSDGTGHLWEKIKERYDSKLDNVVATDDSIVVSNSNHIQVQISTEAGNLLQLKTTGNKGLYVSGASGGGSSDTYGIVKQNDSGNYAAIYSLMRYVNGEGAGIKSGVDINIPKDMVVQSGTVETRIVSGVWGPPGTYIHLVLANAANSDLYIPVDSLIEYVTSGSQSGDMVVIEIDPISHEVTASISDGTITEAKLHSDVQAKLSAADTAVQSITEGATNGTIDVDGTEVPVHGLGSAAFMNSSAFDVLGAAADVLGTNQDAASTATVYGVKQYASDAYAAIKALTNAEIDAAILAASQS